MNFTPNEQLTILATSIDLSSHEAALTTLATLLLLALVFFVVRWMNSVDKGIKNMNASVNQMNLGYVSTVQKVEQIEKNHEKLEERHDGLRQDHNALDKRVTVTEGKLQAFRAG